MDIQKNIDSFAKLGKVLSGIIKSCFDEKEINKDLYEIIESFPVILKKAEASNPWFVKEYVYNAIMNISEALKKNNLENYLNNYKESLKTPKNIKTIGVVMAGNIPLVGFFDFLYVLLSGNKFLGKLSSQDKYLLPFISEILSVIEPEFNDYIQFTEDKLTDFDAIIATGSDNTSRYFEYYFGKYPNIIRKNRNGIAVLTGRETDIEISLLGKDIFSYYGLGCRNVSKIYIPESFSFDRLFENLKIYEKVIGNNKYKNNYDYYKSIYILNKDHYFDNDFMMLYESKDLASPVSVVYYEYYSNLNNLNKEIQNLSDRIQCIVGEPSVIPGAIPFGKSQNPQLWDYADNIDVMDFLIKLK